VHQIDICISSKTFFMKSYALFFLVISSCLFSCSVFSSLHSNTVIEPGKDFVLGNNEHGSFRVQLKNDAKNTIQIYLAPISGGTHSGQPVAPNATVKIKVDKNTALVIQNPNKDTASVILKVTGDTGLNMGYQ